MVLRNEPKVVRLQNDHKRLFITISVKEIRYNMKLSKKNQTFLPIYQIACSRILLLF
jgi:hypothetical protein